MVVVCGHCLVTLSLTIINIKMALVAAHLNAGVILVVSVAIGIQSPSPPTYIPPCPHFSPSVISLMVFVDAKHHVYLLTFKLDRFCDNTNTDTVKSSNSSTSGQNNAYVRERKCNQYSSIMSSLISVRKAKKTI